MPSGNPPGKVRLVTSQKEAWATSLRSIFSKCLLFLQVENERACEQSQVMVVYLSCCKMKGHGYLLTDKHILSRVSQTR